MGNREPSFGKIFIPEINTEYITRNTPRSNKNFMHSYSLISNESSTTLEYPGGQQQPQTYAQQAQQPQ